MKKLFALSLALVLCLSFCACTPQQPAVEPSLSEPEKQPVILEGKNPFEVGLNATLPDGIRLIDPNFSPPDELEMDTVCNVYSGGRYSIFMFVSDIELTPNDFDVLNVNAFKWEDGAPEEYLYQLMTLDGAEDNPKTYEEIEPYIIYRDENRLVIETSEFLGSDLKADMEKYIEENKGIERQETYANGTNVYDYSWLPEAFDLVVDNKDKLIVPVEQ